MQEHSTCAAPRMHSKKLAIASPSSRPPSRISKRASDHSMSRLPLSRAPSIICKRSSEHSTVDSLCCESSVHIRLKTTCSQTFELYRELLWFLANFNRFDDNKIERRCVDLKHSVLHHLGFLPTVAQTLIAQRMFGLAPARTFYPGVARPAHERRLALLLGRPTGLGLDTRFIFLLHVSASGGAWISHFRACDKESQMCVHASVHPNAGHAALDYRAYITESHGHEAIQAGCTEAAKLAMDSAHALLASVLSTFISASSSTPALPLVRPPSMERSYSRILDDAIQPLHEHSLSPVPPSLDVARGCVRENRIGFGH